MNEPFLHGSNWVRFDCHLHTKEDVEFSCVNEMSYFDDYIEKLKSQNIRVGVLTNHNKFDLEEYKTLLKKAKKEGIFLLPGVELSVNDGANGIHTLIVFNPDEWIENGNNFIGQFITTTFAGKHNYENENGRSNDDLINTIKKLNDFKKDYFIILAHVEEKSGFFKEFNGGRITEFGNNPLFRDRVLAFQKVRTRDEVKKWEQWLENSLPVFVEGSDPKSIDEIGKGEKKSYIKIGDFNFEAVKYALGSKELRVSKIPQEPQNARIVSVSFEGGKLDKKQLLFSHAMNNLIGIRGSGKSSIVEAIRYGLGIPFGAKTADINYKNDLVKALLGSGGKVVIEAIDSNKNHYVISRIYGHSPEIRRNGELISIDARTLLGKPLYFGQKDLSNTGSGFEEDLMSKLIGDKTKEITKQIDAKRHEVKLAIQKFVGYKTIEDQKAESLKKIEELNLRKEDFKKYGLEEKLQKQTAFNKDALHVQKLKEKLNDYSSEIASFISSNCGFFTNALGYKSIHNQDIIGEAEALMSDINKDTEEIFAKLEAICTKTKTFEAIEQKFNLRFESLKEEFAKIQRDINMPSLRADDFVSIEKAIQSEQLKLDIFAKKEKERGTLSREIDRLLSELNKLYHEEFKSIKGYIDAINDTQEFIRIEIEYKGNKEAYEEFLRNTFSGTGLRADDYQKLTKYADMTELYKHKDKIEKHLSGNRLLSFNQRFEEKLGECLTFAVPHKITIKYKGKELAKHSLGQRASALIIFILTQKENDIIIIDQPEDDLDNQTIYNEVIKTILALKNSTQFIFATHNANIPVLGDCEQVIICSYDEEKIQVESGSIDKHLIQEKIVNIMEGGSEAFEKRREIYNLWKH